MLAQRCCDVLATVARVRGVVRVKVVVVVGVVSHKGISSEVGSSVMMFLRQVKEVCVLQFQNRKCGATIRKVLILFSRLPPIAQ
jgi:hypothetical protein